jgi:hypothetical protein
MKPYCTQGHWGAPARGDFASNSGSGFDTAVTKAGAVRGRGKREGSRSWGCAHLGDVSLATGALVTLQQNPPPRGDYFMMASARRRDSAGCPRSASNHELLSSCSCWGRKSENSLQARYGGFHRNERHFRRAVAAESHVLERHPGDHQSLFLTLRDTVAHLRDHHNCIVFGFRPIISSCSVNIKYKPHLHMTVLIPHRNQQEDRFRILNPARRMMRWRCGWRSKLCLGEISHHTGISGTMIFLSFVENRPNRRITRA